MSDEIIRVVKVAMIGLILGLLAIAFVHAVASAEEITPLGKALGMTPLFPNQPTPNAYGPNINAAPTGQPFSWQPAAPQVNDGNPFLHVKPNAYGPGIGMDQFGRPVLPNGGIPPGTGPCINIMGACR
jgi:hypothetical protein